MALFMVHGLLKKRQVYCTSNFLQVRCQYLEHSSQDLEVVRITSIFKPFKNHLEGEQPQLRGLLNQGYWDDPPSLIHKGSMESMPFMIRAVQFLFAKL